MRGGLLTQITLNYMHCFSYESPFIYTANRKPYKKVSYLRKVVIK
jgi:hypothetical protein